MTVKRPRLLYLVTEDHYFYSHRLPMARAAKRAGYDVVVIANVDRHRELIEKEGIRVIPFSLERRSLNPLRALAHIMRLCRIYRQEKPDLVHHIAMKPVLYGAIAARLTGVPHVINAFAGLGFLFTSQGMLVRVLRPPLALVFGLLLRRGNSILLLQNRDDLRELRRYGMVRTDGARAVIIRGSGVDLDQYSAEPFSTPAPDFICVFAARMIGIKGLATLKDAFALLSRRAPHVKLWLCGVPDPANPGTWTAEQIGAWVADSDNVSYKSFCPDMGLVWAQAHAAVLPSYGGEGLPKALLVAAACGRALVATDVPGCRDLVTPGVNGFLVPPRDAEALAAAIETLARDPDRARRMGLESRILIEQGGFSADSVAAETEALYRRFL